MESWADAALPDLPGQAPEIMIWDTASGGLAVAAPGQSATIYACGITPYDATHMGHAATYVAWDLLIRAWRDAGHDVTYVQNVTDVDDPLLERADRDGEDWRELAAREIDRFRSDMTALRVLPPVRLIGAVEALPLIEDFNRVLAGHGALYDLEGDIYFARTTDPEFGSVSGLDPETMAKLSAERGGDPARPGKKDPLDPMVWLTARPGEPSWASEFGPGRPGWHVECAAIATHYLGVSFDVQAGGSDLVYPHHEMSASHARVALAGAVPDGDSPVFARRYAHAGMVRLGGEKMSKSLGNLVFVSRLRAAGAEPMAIRLAILAHHYREDWDWTDEGLAAAAGRLARWREAVSLAAAADAPAGDGVLSAMRERMADDLDAPGALAAVDDWAVAVTAAVTGEHVGPRGASGSGGAEEQGGSGRLVRAAVDALLGVEL
ncbi:MAG TPA: cysteine--1-D-myo-inosityl 2-amino-2-deoxy-alpha-D-glucopyranoside ligase [Streptosporangiaceae bacterium]|nr:cysteine--1-D-myo-inosityl 2-amino-2-deoxy-alpha-D-glucopyranoside ligase [Streptosporangiaceae bacterium]